MRLQRGSQGTRFVHQPRGRSDQEGMVPLINVIFLILIFFMIVGHMEATAPIPVKPPVSCTDALPPPEHLALLLAADGRVAVGHEVLSIDTLDTWLKRWMQSRVNADDNAQLPTASVKADGEVQARELRSLLSRLQSAGFRKVTLLTDLTR